MGILEFDYSMAIWIWFIFALVLLVIEIMTVGLTTIWFAAGAFIAGLTAGAGFNVLLQVAVFLAVSVVLLVFTRPWALHYLNRTRIRTNYEREIGKTIILTEDVDNVRQTGRAILEGKEWTVRSASDSIRMKKGDRAVVRSISGVKLIVEKEEEPVNKG